MMNLIHRHRTHIPNGLAIFAALMLLVSSAYGVKSTQSAETSAQQTIAAATTDTGGNAAGEDLGAKKRRGLNLGLLLFRR